MGSGVDGDGRVPGYAVHGFCATKHRTVAVDALRSGIRLSGTHPIGRSCRSINSQSLYRINTEPKLNHLLKPATQKQQAKDHELAF